MGSARRCDRRGVTAMGFKLDFTNMPTDEERWRELLARLDAEFAGVDDPAVHSLDDETPGMLLLLERSIAGGYYDLAASVVAELCGNKAQRLGARARAEVGQHTVDQWHALAKPIWLELRGRFSRARCASIIKDRLGDLVPKDRQIMRAIAKWESPTN
jgi:hypothetical protein